MSYGYEDELTGWEEHVRDEGTWHDYYSEAFGAEARALDAMYEADQAYEQEQWEAKQANPLTSECPEYQGVHPLTLCRIPSKCAADDDCPF